MHGPTQRQGTTLTVYGRPRSAVNFAAGALARSIDPAVICLEVRERDAPAGEVAEAIARRGGARRTFVSLTPEELGPARSTPPPEVGQLLGPGETGAVEHHLADFLGLPEAFQTVWSAAGPEAPQVILVLNSDALGRAYPAGSRDQQAAIRFLLEERVTLVSARTGEVGLDERVDEHIFRITPHPDNDWTLARITSVRGSRWHYDDQPIRGVPLFREYFRVLGLRDLF